MLWQSLVVLLAAVYATGEAEMHEKVCESIDIRRNVNEFQKLAECTVVEGYVKIVLLYGVTGVHFRNVSFPKLREITDSLVLYKVDGLESLSSLFPNLALIRGQQLVNNYALIVSRLSFLENVGLTKLMRIKRGGIRIEKNPKLCYVNTVSWESITSDLYSKDIAIRKNRNPNECADICPVAGTRGLCFGQPYCWTNTSCQQMCPKSCPGSCYYSDVLGELRCCHKECLGGCSGVSDQDCYSCANFFYARRCVESCPSGTYKHRDRRCVTEDECRRPRTVMDHGLNLAQQFWKVLPSGNCDLECPVGYQASSEDVHICVKCEGPCPKVCRSNIINSREDAQHLRGCVKIDGDLEISLRGGNLDEEDLEIDLGSIEEVTGVVHVTDSTLTSLRFLSRLQYVGRYTSGHYNESFMVHTNYYLQDLWDVNIHPNLTVMNGEVQFIGNPRLCVSTIQNFTSNMALVNASLKKEHYTRVNGYMAACDIVKVILTVELVGQRYASIKWGKLNDPRMLLNWAVHFRNASENDTENSVQYNLRGECGEASSKRWLVVSVKSDEFQNLLTGLTPAQKYVVYVEANTIRTDSVGALSNFQFFTTLTAAPSEVRKLFANPTSMDTIDVTWDSPAKPNGRLSHYSVQWYPAVMPNYDELKKRDYCRHPVQDERLMVEHKILTTTAIVPTDVSHCCSCPTEGTKFEADSHDYLFEDHLNDLIHIRDNSNPPNSDRHSLLFGVKPLNQTNSSSVTEASPDATSWRSDKQFTSSEVDVTPQYSFQGTKLSSNVTFLTINNLVHFQDYIISVRACNGELCGSWTEFKTRTHPNGDADTIEEVNVTAMVASEAQHRMLINWNKPPSPNGLIVAYDIDLIQDDKHASRPLCYTNQMFEQKRGFITDRLSPGNWSYKIRATSLAGPGRWTSARFFLIIDTGDTESQSGVSHILINVSIFVALVLAVVLIVVIVFYFKRRRQRAIYKDFFFSSNVNYFHSDEAFALEEWEVPREKVKLSDVIGQGSFGMVYRGTMLDAVSGESEQPVAIKTINGCMRRQDYFAFLMEAHAMQFLNCHHIVKLHGVVSKGSPTLVIMELMSNGDLKRYLRARRPEVEDGEQGYHEGQKITSDTFIRMAAEIADGMAYMAAKKFVHRDLAARNCMVSSDMTVKVGDFGMARDIYTGDYCKKGTKGLLPVRWMAPESLRDGVFTVESDVWSFGVVLWEMAKFAEQPYPGLSNEQVLQDVISGKTMAVVSGFCEILSKLMVACWNRTPSKRPMFSQIVELLAEHLPNSFRCVSSHLNGVKSVPILASVPPSQSQCVAEHNAIMQFDTDAVSDSSLPAGNSYYANTDDGATAERGEPDGVLAHEGINCEINYMGSGNSANDSVHEGDSDLILIRKSSDSVDTGKRPQHRNKHFNWFVGLTQITRGSSHSARHGY